MDRLHCGPSALVRDVFVECLDEVDLGEATLLEMSWSKPESSVLWILKSMFGVVSCLEDFCLIGSRCEDILSEGPVSFLSVSFRPVIFFWVARLSIMLTREMLPGPMRLVSAGFGILFSRRFFSE